VTRLTLATLASIALFGIACAESTTGLPSPRMNPTGSAAHDEGLPPPPPLTGSGDGTLDVFGSDLVANASVSTSALPNCTSGGSVAFTYSFDYLLNKTDNSSFAHLDVDNQSQNVTIHQTVSNIDAHGLIKGSNFTFFITDAISGTLSLGGFNLLVEGTVTFADGSKCHATASLSGSLVGEIGD